MSETTARSTSVLLPDTAIVLWRRLLLLLMRVMLLMLVWVVLVMMTRVDSADIMLSAQSIGVGVGRLFTAA